ncbi:putative reverse transcriptase domain-containing protein, partial [Tanacetum coccineum]
MKATNIILQGLPADTYSLVNHHKVAKDLWERVQLLMQGTSLTKQERECKLYDAFDKFTHIKEESLHTYYFLPPEWSKFVTDVKLVKDLHTSNFDQLHAYLEQHELHANKVCIMRERNQDPLAFVANQQMTPPHFNTYKSSYNNPQLQRQFSPLHHASIQPNQHYSSHYPSQTQFNHSSIPPSHTYQSQMNHQTLTVPEVIQQVAYQSPQTPTQLMTESPFVDSGFVVPVFSPGDDPITCLNKSMAIASSRFPTTNNQLRTSYNLRNQATIQDGRVTVQQVQGRQGQNYSGNTYKSNATSSRGNTTSGQERVIELFSDYDCEIRYHSGKANVVDDALSRKERVKPKRVRAMNMILQSSTKDRILAAQKEAVDEFAVLQKGLDEMIEQRSDGTLYYLDQIWVPLKGEVRTLIMDEAHKPKYSVHPGADKMYYDLRDKYWWPEMKKDLAKYEGIAMDFMTKLPRTSIGHDTIWVIVDRLTKSAHFLPMREDYKMERLARLYLNEIVARHGVPILIRSDRDS